MHIHHYRQAIEVLELMKNGKEVLSSRRFKGKP